VIRVTVLNPLTLRNLMIKSNEYPDDLVKGSNFDPPIGIYLEKDGTYSRIDSIFISAPTINKKVAQELFGCKSSDQSQ
jgi:hypothetical protein